MHGIFSICLFEEVGNLLGRPAFFELSMYDLPESWVVELFGASRHAPLLVRILFSDRRDVSKEERLRSFNFATYSGGISTNLSRDGRYLQTACLEKPDPFSFERPDMCIHSSSISGSWNLRVPDHIFTRALDNFVSALYSQFDF